jgi:hypothetical protein
MSFHLPVLRMQTWPCTLGHRVPQAEAAAEALTPVWGLVEVDELHFLMQELDLRMLEMRLICLVKVVQPVSV